MDNQNDQPARLLALAGISLPGICAISLERAGDGLWRVGSFEIKDGDRRLSQKITAARVRELLDEVGLQRARPHYSLDDFASGVEEVRRLFLVATALKAALQQQRAAHKATIDAIALVRRRMLAKIALAESHGLPKLAADHRVMLASHERFARAEAPIRIEEPWRESAVQLAILYDFAFGPFDEVTRWNPRNKRGPLAFIWMLLKEIGAGDRYPATIANTIYEVWSKPLANTIRQVRSRRTAPPTKVTMR